MPITDDEYRAEALGAMIALVAQLDRAPHRIAALATARSIRALLARADQVLKQPGETDELYEMAGAARDRIVKSMGTSAWDEPEAPKHSPLPAAPGPGVLDRVNGREPPPLMDEELDGIERRSCVGIPPTTRELLEYASGARAAVPRLLAEVRRLRALHYDQVLDDIGKLREAVGLPNVALPISPRVAMGEAIEQARRLHSDEWLQRACDEIAEAEDPLNDALAILRKHRDGSR
jgi:hypothetical protein